MRLIGTFEEFVMLGLQKIGGGCCTDIQRALKSGGIKRSVQNVYITIYRLEKRKLVSSFSISARKIRGGRERRGFMITKKGEKLLIYTKSIRDKLQPNT